MGSGGFLLTYFAAGIFGCVVQQLRHLIMLRQNAGTFLVATLPLLGLLRLVLAVQSLAHWQ